MDDVLDLNDFEYQQDLYSGLDLPETTPEDELLLTPYDKPYRLDNWPVEDLEAYCGIYEKGIA